MDGKYDGTFKSQTINEINDSSKPKITCQGCKIAGSVECFPKREICADYESAFDVPQNEREAQSDTGFISRLGKQRYDMPWIDNVLDLKLSEKIQEFPYKNQPLLCVYCKNIVVKRWFYL